MAVAGNPGVGRFHEPTDYSYAGHDGYRPERRNLLGDPGQRGASEGPLAFGVPDMVRVKKHLGGRRIRDLAGGLERQES